MRNACLILFAAAALGHAGAGFLSAEVIRSTVAPDTFVYRGRSARDPFVPLARGVQSASESTIKTPEEVEQEFDPSSLVVKALLGGAGKRGGEMAVIGSSANTQDNYLVAGNRIKHISSGNILKSYVAQVQSNQVIIKRIQGQPLMVAVTFPNEEEEESP